MSEKAEGRPRIVVNARGEEREVPPPEAPATPKQETKPKGKSKGFGQRVGEFAEGAAAGAVAGEVVENVINKGAKAIREKLYGSGERKKASGMGGGRGSEPPGEPPSGEKGEKEPNGLGNLNFEQIEVKLQDPNLNKDDREFLQKRRERIIDDISNFDDKNFLRDTKNTFTTTLKTSKWDEVYSRLIDQGASIDDQLMHAEGADPRWRGAVKQGFRAEAASVLVSGIESKEKNGKVADDWYRRHDYTDEEIARLKSVADKKHVFDFAPDAPEEFIGSALEKEESGISALRQLLEQPERRQSLREVPLYFGAVFKGGKNEVYVDRPDLIPTLEIKNENDRNRFIFKNIHAFDYRFGKGSAWKGAITDWVADFKIANEGANISPEQRDIFLKKLSAMMAVTASARAMENSAGVAKTYLTNLVGANERGDPNLDEQDLSGPLLLHADPEKMTIILEDPLVKRYYDKLMADAGLVNDAEHEWHKITDSEGKEDWMASTIELIHPAAFQRDRSPLIEYLKDSARAGGLQEYIEKVLLESDNPRLIQELNNIGFTKEVRMAAARIACDVFLVDKWSRWEDAITEHDLKVSGDLSLQPQIEWGGDPLKGIIRPTFLPHLKKVYTGRDEAILNLVDRAIKPDDIFARIQKDARKYEDVSRVHTVIPSMVTNLKTFSRISDATYKVFGGSMATGLPNWSPKMLQEELPQIADLLTQVYGNLSLKETGGGKIPIGKHIVGDMMMRLLYAKALATTVESSRPGFREKMSVIFDPQAKTRPFLEVMQSLYGPYLDAKSGFIQSLTGGRTRLVIKDNMFGAEKYFKGVYELLQTDDQGTLNQARMLNNVGLGFDILKAIGEGFGITKGR